MKRRKVKGSLTAALCTSVILGSVSIAPAQTQPAAASNGQDERVNINRSVDSESESFKILRSGDKSEINRYVTRVYELEHANPYEILPYLRTAAALEKGSVITAWNPQASGSALSWIQVNVPDFQLPYMDAAVAAYDVKDFASIPGDIKFSYRTKYRAATEVADFIRATTLSPDGAIRGDFTTNTIYVQDSPSDFGRVLAQIQFYDIPTPQLDLELSIVELTLVDQTSLGLDWDAWKSVVGGGAVVAGTDSHAEFNDSFTTKNHTDIEASSISGVLSVDATALAGFLNYLIDKGDAEVLARTNLTVANGSTGVLISNTGVPEYQYVYDPNRDESVLKEDKQPETDPSAEGITVTVSPAIAMNAAKMEIDITVRSPVAIGQTGEPIYSNQTVSSDLTLAQDQLFKMGGIRRGVTTMERKGFPFLMDVPGLKYLFSNETTILRDTEVYVFMKPTWTTPLVPDSDAMKISSTTDVDLIGDILQSNPNISISPKDAEILQEYFDATSGG